MNKVLRTSLATALLCLTASATPPTNPEVLRALQRMYNFDFPGAHRILDAETAKAPDESITYWTRAAAYLFAELDRMRILQSEFFESDKRIGSSQKIPADPAVKSQFLEALSACRKRASARLASMPNDVNSLFSLAISDGLESDYLSLIEKKQLGSFRPAKESQQYAVKTLRADPSFADAKLTTGISEYLVGSLPFFVRWAVHWDSVQGSKEQAVANLTDVSNRGIYLGPFARILLSIIAIREKQPDKARTLLSRLASEYPENPLFRRELGLLSTR